MYEYSEGVLEHKNVLGAKSVTVKASFCWILCGAVRIFEVCAVVTLSIPKPIASRNATTWQLCLKTFKTISTLRLAK